MNGTSTSVETRSFALGRLYERITNEIAQASEEIQISEEDLTQRLGALLLLGTEERSEDRVRTQPLRLPTTKLAKGVRKVEGRSSSSDGSSRKKASGIKAYWASMTPEQRASEMARRMKKRQKAA